MKQDKEEGTITQVDENAALTWAYTRSQEHWVSHIFANVRTTKSFSLAALFSTCKSRSVTALRIYHTVPYETTAAAAAAAAFRNENEGLSLLSQERTPAEFQWEMAYG